MEKRFWLFPCVVVLVASATFVHQFSYGKEISVAVPSHTQNDASVVPAQPATQEIVGRIEFTGFATTHWYNISLQPVKQIGVKYAQITSGTTNGIGGVFSGVLNPGTILYEIPGIDPSKALAVPWKGSYVEAVRTS